MLISFDGDPDIGAVVQRAEGKYEKNDCGLFSGLYRKHRRLGPEAIVIGIRTDGCFVLGTHNTRQYSTRCIGVPNCEMNR